MSTPAIERLSGEEKLRALEELWDAITREGDRYESPAWHEQELKETQGCVYERSRRDRSRHGIALRIGEAGSAAISRHLPEP